MREPVIRCKICNSIIDEIFKEEILNKYKIKYYQCPNCLFIQTEKVFWLKEAYISPININDTGILSRSIKFGLKTFLIIKFFFNGKGRYLDYGGGLGIFTRLMRDWGFDYYWYDPYTENHLARGFEGKLNRRYNLVTLFEALEHFDNPKKEFTSLFELSDNILFSTNLVPKPTPKPEEWSYFSFNHGQHIGFFSEETLRYLAEKYSYEFYTDGKFLHLFTKKRISKILFKFVTSRLGLLLLPILFFSKKTKTLSDSEKLSKEMSRDSSVSRKSSRISVRM